MDGEDPRASGPGGSWASPAWRRSRASCNPEALIQELTGTSKVESRKLVGVGRMLAEAEEAEAQAAAAEAEAARRLLDEALDPALDPDAPARIAGAGRAGRLCRRFGRPLLSLVPLVPRRGTHRSHAP